MIDTIRAQIRQSILGIVAEERHLLAGVHIATNGRDMGQIFRACCLADVLSHLLLDALHAHLLVVAQRHSPTTIKAQDALSLNRMYA